MSERILAYLGATAHRLPVSCGLPRPAVHRAGRARRRGRRGRAAAGAVPPQQPHRRRLRPGGRRGAGRLRHRPRHAGRGRPAVLPPHLRRPDYVHLSAQPGMAARTVTLAGPSKTESMSGYRVGAAVGPAPVIDAMERVLSLAALRTAGYGQQVLRHWMADDADWLADRTAAHQALRDELVGRLRRHPRRHRGAPGGQLLRVPGRVRAHPAAAPTITPSPSPSRRPGCWSAPATSSARPAGAGSASTSPRTPAASPWPATASRPSCAAELRKVTFR